MNGSRGDLAQEADLTAQVVVEVGQAPVVTVVHPGVKTVKSERQGARESINRVTECQCPT